MPEQQRPKGVPDSRPSYKDDGIGLEDTPSNFEDLLGQAASLTPDEARTELLDCARYGETDAVRAILDRHQNSATDGGGNDSSGSGSGAFVDSTDPSGSTALHKAAANGHALTTRLLLSRGAAHIPNASGNTPLHWAAANGHEEVVRLLLSEPRFKGEGGIDVLQKNSFGRSALTEGFGSQNTKLVGLLLEHDSAEEERLLGGVKKSEVESKEGDGAVGNDTAINEDGSVNTTDTGSSGAACVVHEFDFRRRVEGGDAAEDVQTLLVRELPIANADDPFGAKAEEDTTGLGIWCASLVMARWMASEAISARLDGKSVLELGAGCGVPGLAAALYSKAKSVHLTDLNPATIRNMQYNIDLNKDRPATKGSGDWCERVTASVIDWGDQTTWPKERLDFVIGSDLIYQASIVPLLRQVVEGLLKPKAGTFFYVCPDGGRDGLPEFIKAMTRDGFKYASNTIAPDAYRQNPLSSEDDEDCFLHFHELASTTYVLHEFTRTTSKE